MGWIFVVFVLLIILVMGPGVYFIYRIIKKSVTPKTDDYIQNEKKEMEARVQAQIAELEPMNGLDYNAVTSAMQYTYKKTTSVYIKGKVFSPERKPIIAFDRVERGLTGAGYLIAASSSFSLWIDFDDRYMKYTLNGELLGEVLPSGDLVNANGEKIGSAYHPTKVSFYVANFTFRSGDNFFPLALNGRTLANIYVAPNYGAENPASMEVIFNQNQWGLPILHLLEKPTEEEERWLMALAVTEIALHGHWGL